MKSKRPSLADLTPEQRDALIAFAQEHGRNWKAALISGWLRAAFPGYLQQIRNSFGPEWLTKLPPIA